MRKITADVEHAVRRRIALGEPGRAAGTLIARGEGWSVEDVLCTSGPDDRPFEERHNGVSIGIVMAGTFQYRTTGGHGMLTPGSLLLGNDGQCYECSHTHALGDRCVAFHFTPEFFDRIAAEAGSQRTPRVFRAGRLPPLRATAGISALAAAGLVHADAVAWDELGIALVAAVLRQANGVRALADIAPPGAEARVTESVRTIERDPSAPLTLHELAAAAQLSPFHYLRMFRRVTGVTPHQFVLRTRLREAATRLATDSATVLAIAYASGFGDLSNFNHAFRAEFASSPRGYRRARNGLLHGAAQ